MFIKIVRYGSLCYEDVGAEKRRKLNLFKQSISKAEDKHFKVSGKEIEESKNTIEFI